LSSGKRAQGNKLTILFLISSEGYYGAENMLVALGRGLSQLGCRCVVAVFDDFRFHHTEVAEQARRQGLTVEIFPCAGKWDWKAIVEIRKLLVRHNVDVVHSHGYKSDFYAYMAAWPNRALLFATSHNWPSKRFSMRVYAAIDRLILRRFDKVVVVSEVVLAALTRSGVAAEKIATIFNGVDIERFREAKPTLPAQMIHSDCPVVGFVARLVPDKGGEFLLRAAQQVLAEYPKTTFVFVGEGPSRKQLERLAGELGIDRHVVFAGARDDMPGVYASLDVLVLPSLVESMPMCVLEAMAAGKPVIATHTGAIPKVVASEENGLLIEPGDVSSLRDAIVRLLADKEFARRLSENGRRCVRQKFSAQAMAKSYLDQYRELLTSRRGRLREQPAPEAGCR
jgi:glycosyltransferase involved in cell wall biosynthesis